MALIKIEKDIAPPLDAALLAHEMKEMQPGDSFFVPGCTSVERSAYTRAAGLIAGFVMTSAKATDTSNPEVKGLRFWRVATRTVRKYEPKTTP